MGTMDEVGSDLKALKKVDSCAITSLSDHESRRTRKYDAYGFHSASTGCETCVIGRGA